METTVLQLESLVTSLNQRTAEGTKVDDGKLTSLTYAVANSLRQAASRGLAGRAALADYVHRVLTAAASLWEHGARLRMSSQSGSGVGMMPCVSTSLSTEDMRHNEKAVILRHSAWQLILATDPFSSNDQLEGHKAIEKLKMCAELSKELLELKQFENAEVCLSEGSHFIPAVKEWLTANTGNVAGNSTCQANDGEAAAGLVTLFDVYVVRIKVLWHMEQSLLAQQLVADCTAMLRELATPRLGVLETGALCIELCDELISLATQSMNHLPASAQGSTAENGSRDAAALPGHSVRDNQKQTAVIQMLQTAHGILLHGEMCCNIPQSACAGVATQDTGLQARKVATAAAIDGLRARVLAWLAHAHLLAGQPTQALAVLQRLRVNGDNRSGSTTETETAQEGSGGFERHPIARALYVQALLACGDTQEVESELLVLAADDKVPVQLCLHCLQLAMQPASASAGSEQPQANDTDLGIPALALLPTFQAVLRRCGAAERGKVTLQFLLYAAMQHQCAEQQPQPTAQKLVAQVGFDALLRELLIPQDNHPDHPANILLSSLAADHVDCDMQPTDTSSEPSQAQAIRSGCRELLWTRGVHYFHQRAFADAIPLLQASQSYSDVSQRVEGCKVLAMANMAIKENNKALDQLKEAEALVYGSNKNDDDVSTALPVVVPFLQLKIYVDQGNVPAACDQLMRLPDCDGYTPALLEVVVQEAVNNKAYSIACEALGALHSNLVDNPSSVSGYCEADILRCHIKCLKTRMEKEGILKPGIEKQPMSVSDAMAPKTDTLEAYNQLAHLFNVFHKRLDAVGYSLFFGASSSEAAAVAGLDWFAFTGKRLGAAAGQAGCSEACAVLCVAVVNALGHHPAPSTTVTRTRKLTAVMAAVALVSISNDVPSKKAASLKLASSMLSQSREFSSMCGSSTEPQNAPVEQQLTYYEVLVAAMSGDAARLKQLVEQVLPGLPAGLLPAAEQLLELAELCKSDTTQEIKQCAAAMYGLALRQLVASQSPDCQLVALALRSSVELCSSDTGRLSAYKEAALLLSQVTNTSKNNNQAVESSMAMDTDEDASTVDKPLCDNIQCLPVAEIQWLVATCWNRGAHHQRFLNAKDAAQFMQTALDLLRFTPSQYQSTNMPMMQQQLSRAIKHQA